VKPSPPGAAKSGQGLRARAPAELPTRRARAVHATRHIGKYHVGGHDSEETIPENVGFDINIGGYSQGHQPSCFATKKADEWKFKGVGLGNFDRFGAPYSEAYVNRRGLPAELVGTPKHISDAVGDALEETVAKLYCLSDDQGEEVTLIKEQPEIATELSKKVRDWLTQKHPTWKPKYPISKSSGKPAGPPPLYTK